MTDRLPHAADAPGLTEILVAWGEGDESALTRLAPLVHAELRRLAQLQMRGERGGHTLQATALVNEAYLRLSDLSRIRWKDRRHFFAMAVRMMRRVLVDYARTRLMQKRGAGLAVAPLDENLALATAPSVDVIAVNDALDALEAVAPRQAQVVELRYFGGLSVAETADVLGVSVETVARDWRAARLWLFRELSDARPS